MIWLFDLIVFDKCVHTTCRYYVPWEGARSSMELKGVVQVALLDDMADPRTPEERLRPVDVRSFAPECTIFLVLSV